MGWTILNQGQGTNIHGLTLETSVTPTVDEIIFYDDSAGGNRRATIDSINLPASGLAQALDLSGKTLTLPPSVISGQSAVASTEDADCYLVWDATDSTLKKVAQSTMATAISCVVQVLQAVYTDYSSVTNSLIPTSGIPSSSAGTSILSKAITLSKSTNKVLCTVHAGSFSTSVAGSVVAALFRGTTCIAAQYVGIPTAAYSASTASFSILDSPGGNQTYSVRVGTSANAVLYINGYSGSQYWGGALTSSLTLQEIRA